jgi:hypothetical protein
MTKFICYLSAVWLDAPMLQLPCPASLNSQSHWQFGYEAAEVTITDPPPQPPDPQLLLT